MERMWIDVEGLANLRDVGGTPTIDGQSIASGRLLRSDNLQSLTEADITRLLGMGLTDVIDLRSGFEVASEGPGPLIDRPGVTFHQHSLFNEAIPGQGEPKPDVRPEVLPEDALPWVDRQPTVQLENAVASVYLSYLVDRPDSIVAALREIAQAEGASLVHCAAGKDRTGTVVALALILAGADRDAVVRDYAASSERVQGIVDRLMSSSTYAVNLSDRPLSSHVSHPETMVAFLDHIDAQYGGVQALLIKIGWTHADTEQIRAKLRD